MVQCFCQKLHLFPVSSQDGANATIILMYSLFFPSTESARDSILLCFALFFTWVWLLMKPLLPLYCCYEVGVLFLSKPLVATFLCAYLCFFSRLSYWWCHCCQYIAAIKLLGFFSSPLESIPTQCGCVYFFFCPFFCSLYPNLSILRQALLEFPFLACHKKEMVVFYHCYMLAQIEMLRKVTDVL